MRKLLTKEEILSIAKEKGIKISFLNSLISGYRGKMTDWKNGKTTLTTSELTILTEYLLSQGTSNLNNSEKLLIIKYRNMSDEQKEKLLKSLTYEEV